MPSSDLQAHLIFRQMISRSRTRSQVDFIMFDYAPHRIASTIQPSIKLILLSMSMERIHECACCREDLTPGAHQLEVAVALNWPGVVKHLVGVDVMVIDLVDLRDDNLDLEIGSVLVIFHAIYWYFGRLWRH